MLENQVMEGGQGNEGTLAYRGQDSILILKDTQKQMLLDLQITYNKGLGGTLSSHQMATCSSYTNSADSFSGITLAEKN